MKILHFLCNVSCLSLNVSNLRVVAEVSHVQQPNSIPTRYRGRIGRVADKHLWGLADLGKQLGASDLSWLQDVDVQLISDGLKCTHFWGCSGTSSKSDGEHCRHHPLTCSSSAVPAGQAPASGEDSWSPAFVARFTDAPSALNAMNFPFQSSTLVFWKVRLIASLNPSWKYRRATLMCVDTLKGKSISL